MQGIDYCAIGDNSAEGFGLKTTWSTPPVGGLSAMRTIRDLCHAHSLPHLCEGVWIAAPYIDHHYDSTNGIKIENGWLNLPTSSGLGIIPDTSLFGSPVQSYG